MLKTKYIAKRIFTLFIACFVSTMSMLGNLNNPVFGLAIAVLVGTIYALTMHALLSPKSALEIRGSK